MRGTPSGMAAAVFAGAALLALGLLTMASLKISSGIFGPEAGTTNIRLALLFLDF